jgi:hypothetical protein
VGEIYLAGAKPLAPMEAERVDKALKELRLDSAVAVEVLAQVRHGARPASKTRSCCQHEPSGPYGPTSRGL